jgi:hypothetical protein
MPNAPAGYKYSIDAYELNKYSTDKESFPSIYGVKFNKSKQVMIDSQVIYRVTVYKDSTVIPDGGVPITGNGNVKSRVLSTGPYATFKEAVKTICDVKGIRTIEDKYYDFTLVPKGINGTVTPKFTVQVEINGIWADVTTVFGTSIPSSIFSKKATPPGVPENVSATDAGFAFGQNPEYEWCSKTRIWARRWLHNAVQVNRTADEVKKGLGPKWEVTITVKYFDEIGTELKKEEKRLNNKREFNYDVNKKDSGWQKAKKLLADQKNCNLTAGGGGGGGSSVTPTPESVKAASNFNPYPHLTTRHFPKNVWDDAGNAGSNPYDQLATMYIDPDTVDITSGKAKNKDKYSKAAALNRFWGFRFLFNPQYFSYNMSANSKVDWTRPNENGAVLVAEGIGGNISVNILLDRVADMVTLRLWDEGGRGTLLRGPYPVDMTPEQCAGILNRGTEYDLEYLFRVLNGNPQETTLLGNPSKDLEMLSANMGYIAQIPFVFKIQDHMRYKVILQSINVSHEMFTRDMIPIRTVVQLGLERLPDIPTKGSKYKEADILTQIGPLLKAQNTNTSGGGGGRGSSVAK